MSLFRRPPHCRTCGDELVEASYIDGHRESDGTAVFRTWRKCPRSLDSRPIFLGGDDGRCHLAPWACAVEREAYADHRPPRCTHYSVSESGDACWLKDRTPVTVGGRVLEPIDAAARLAALGFA